MGESVEKVFPGDIIGVMEEFIPGSGVYVDENGYLRASMMGELVRDLKNKCAKIKRKNILSYPKPGSIVTGIVTSIRNDIAVITIISEENSSGIPNPLTGILHVSQVTQGYVKTLYDAISLGDMIKAQVLSSENPFQLSIKNPSLGVILSTCSKCGAVLRKDRKGRLVCPRCRSIEHRKTSTDYINLKKVI